MLSLPSIVPKSKDPVGPNRSLTYSPNRRRGPFASFGRRNTRQNSSARVEPGGNVNWEPAGGRIANKLRRALLYPNSLILIGSCCCAASQSGAGGSPG
jgi:hypothetical protein